MSLLSYVDNSERVSFRQGLESWKHFLEFFENPCFKVSNLSVDELPDVLADVLRPVGDGGEDGSDDGENAGHDEEDDVALGGHEDAPAAAGQPGPVLDLLDVEHLDHTVGRCRPLQKK